jgi:hypothetical protein
MKVTIKGFSDQPCVITGKEDNVVQAAFADGSFSGNIHIFKIIDLMKTKLGVTNGPADRTRGGGETESK